MLINVKLVVNVMVNSRTSHISLYWLENNQSVITFKEKPHLTVQFTCLMGLPLGAWVRVIWFDWISVIENPYQFMLTMVYRYIESIIYPTVYLQWESGWFIPAQVTEAS